LPLVPSTGAPTVDHDVPFQLATLCAVVALIVVKRPPA
jgi:hypothetical protein